MQEHTGQVTQTQAPPPSLRRKSKKKWILILIILALAAGGTFFLFQSPKPEELEETLEPIATEEQEFPTPTPTPIPVPVDRSVIRIEVLNGTGIAKEASFLKGKFEELGYSQIEVGNADDQTHTTTIVAFSSAIADEVREEILEKLEDIYQKLESTETDLKDLDIRVITGLRHGQTLPTPTPTVQPTPTPEATDSASPQ